MSASSHSMIIPRNETASTLTWPQIRPYRQAAGRSEESPMLAVGLRSQKAKAPLGEAGLSLEEARGDDLRFISKTPKHPSSSTLLRGNSAADRWAGFSQRCILQSARYAGTRPPKNGINAWLSACARPEVKIISAPAVSLRGRGRRADRRRGARSQAPGRSSRPAMAPVLSGDPAAADNACRRARWCRCGASPSPTKQGASSAAMSLSLTSGH